MDAQNAGELTTTKPAASPKRMGSDADQPRSSAVTKLSSIAKPELSVKDGSRSSASGSHLRPHDDNNSSDGNSDAETIVLPGKDGQHSPSKVRKHIKHEDKSDGEDAPPISSIGRKHSNVKQDRDRESENSSNNNNTSHKGDGNSSSSSRIDRGDRGDKGDRVDKSSRSASLVRNNGPSSSNNDREGGNASSSALGAKKKKQHPDKAKIKDGSSGLSSAPTSPPVRRRRPSNAHSKSDSEPAPVDSPRTCAKEKPPVPKQSVDKLVPHKRKATRPESDDEAESRKVRRQRTSGSGLDASRKPHLPSTKSHHEAHSSSNRTRSPSPPARPHRRSISSQLAGQFSNGLSQKKRRIPAPLQSTDYHSDESSAGGSPHPRSSKQRNLTTPATAESTVSPMKMAPHKKHLDAHGQTFLARACAKGEYEIAKQRLQERPEDINVADYAGNTPLQIAALNGYEDIVKLLVEAGCNLDCVNNEKDTPLIDAVENGHLGAVKILLDAGVNPRKANAHGEEPIFRIDEGTEHAAEIRRALVEAKKKMGERRLTSEDHNPDQGDGISTHGAESPQRRSPGVSGMGQRRQTTNRATKTRNDLLYMQLDNKTLRIAAGKGDQATVERCLQVRETIGVDDPEPLVAAARGGHEMVVQLLLAIGNANPDPPPISTDPSNREYATPMLAAIGQENLNIVKLLLEQTSFNPTQRYKGETYYDIARRRRGPNWVEEETILKKAYDEYKESHKDTPTSRSPNRREQSRDPRKSRVEEPTKDDAAARAHKRKASSPTREPKKSIQAKPSASPKEKRRSSSFSGHPEDRSSPKRGPGRPKKEDRIPTIAISDRETSPARKPAVKKRAAESDLPSEGEVVKPRRKLVSRGELMSEQKNRRASLTSNASSLKEPSSPREEGEKVNKMDRYHDRAKALKRDESRDRLSVTGESTGKRHRASATPPYPGAGEKDPGEGPVKKRRLDTDGKERRPKPNLSDDKHLKAPSARDSASSPASASRNSSKGARDDDDRRPIPKLKRVESQADHARRDTPKPTASVHIIRIKDEDTDLEMPDADTPAKDVTEARVSLQKRKDDDERKRQQASKDEAIAREAKKKEEERKRREEEEMEKEFQEKERLRIAEEIKRRAEAEARQRVEDEERQKQEEEKKRREEEERRKREEEEERKQKEQEEQRQEEERRKRAEEERKQKEEEERKQRQEEERIRKEQLERRAAEEAEAQRQREEHERNERERAHREAEQRARDAERKRRAEQERARVEKLPPLLRWLETAVNPKQPEAAKLFSLMQGIRYDCIDLSANGTAEGREQWLLNTQVALLLGEKDLDLSRYTAWTRKPVSPAAKLSIWRVESDRYSLTEQSLYELGRQLGDYYEGKNPEVMGHETCRKLKLDAWNKFSAMDLFFVKVSDFMYIVPNIPHLRNVELTIQYREFAADGGWRSEKKFKNDPDAAQYHGYVPDSKHYLNGELLPGSKSGAQIAVTSSVPFPTHKVVRRGWTAVSQDDPEYGALSKQQNPDDSLGDIESPRLANGVHNSSPMSASSHHLVPGVTNGVRSPVLVAATAATANGASAHHPLNQPISPSSESGPAQARPLVNGTHGLANGDNRGNP